MMLTKHFYNIQKKYINLKDQQHLLLEQEVKNKTKEIKQHLDEKDILLKEVYHRVKNNFQMVISILGIESYKIKDIKQKSHFLELINRLKSVSLVHEFLYNSNSLAQISSQEYLFKIIEQIESIYSHKKVVIDADIQATLLSMDDAITIGMISNELITNSIKYHQKETCNIIISFKNVGEYTELIIQDDGEGFDENLIENSKGLGLNLIKEFSQKLSNADYMFKTEEFTYFKLKFTQ